MSKIKSIISDIKVLSVVELSELIAELQSEFGVSAAAMSMGAVGADTENKQEKVEAKSSFKLELIEIGGDKPKIIKALRVVRKELGLIEAKNATENLPYLVFAEAGKDDIEAAKKVLEEAGAKVKIS